MPVFSLDNGRLSPARSSLSHSEEIVRETLMAVRDQVVELIYRPIFPVAWLTETSRNAGRHTSLVAMDPSGKTVTVDVFEELDTATLMGSLARASRHEEIPRGRLSGLYPRGAAAFRKDWQEFLDSCPSGLENHPRLIILAVNVDDEVRAALDSLVGASIEVHRIDLHESRSGLLVSLEQVRPHEASFLAIGRAVRRGEISPPTDESPEPAPVLEPAESTADGYDAAEAVEAAETPVGVSADETAAQADGVVFVSKSKKAPVDQKSKARDSDESITPSEGDPDVEPGDARAAQDQPDGDEPDDAAIPSEPRREVSADPEDESDPVAHADDVAAERTVDDAALARADVARPEGADAVGAATEAADDDSDRFTFRSAGLSPDAAEPTDPWSADSESLTPRSFAWPERTTELQDVAARFGEQNLSFRSLRRRVNATALLTADGEIVLENGHTFTDPDEAASAVAGRRMDGWKNWRTEDGTRLGELRR